MEKFTKDAEPVYKNEQLQNHQADHLAQELRKEAEQNVKDKFYIKRNMQTVMKIDRENAIRKQNEAADKGWVHRTGELPQYIVNRKKEEEYEKQEMIRQIEQNKRPQGTVRLSDHEIQGIRGNLEKTKGVLVNRIEKTSVTLWTTRARRQNMGIVNNMKEVDKALTVFERDRVFVKKN